MMDCNCMAVIRFSTASLTLKTQFLYIVQSWYGFYTNIPFMLIYPRVGGIIFRYFPSWCFARTFLKTSN